MSQQTPVSRIEPAWRAWLRRWPDPAALAAASPAEVIRAWDRLGYPRRALRLRECAIALMQRHGGRIPDDEQALLNLPGIGPYTAAAIMAFAFRRRSLVLDTNVRRVLGRVLIGEPLPAAAPTAAERMLADTIAPRDDERCARWSAAAMEVGALVCVARSPRCEACPLRDACRWRALGYPAGTRPARRTQSWSGSDRQVRGLLMAVLRETSGPVTREQLLGAWPQRPQAESCLASLLADGLAVETDDGDLALPG